jgi:BASS family bile acid:Na+ symporter
MIPVIQFVMFCMGTTLCFEDFKRVMKMPQAVIIGIVLHYIIMPLSGYFIAKSFNFDPMIALGIMLIGASPSGVASNVINYLARGDVALSVTLTTVSTLISPIMTPLAMLVLAGQFATIDFTGMMVSILKMIIVPVFAGLIVNKIFQKYSSVRDRILPPLSMMALCVSVIIITSLSRDSILKIGIAVFIATAIHNTLGYLLGYWGGRLFKLSEASCRTIAVEVGMQNGAMASGLAINVFNSAQAALPPAIFGAWQNVSGSILASIWRSRPTQKPVKTQTSRSDIYYWKCDNPLPVEEKLLYNNKYELADISGLVQKIAVDYLGHNSVLVTPAGGQGNHYTYIIHDHGREIFFRADDGKINDDYMMAEKVAMGLVSRHGVRVPELYHCDVSMSRFPVRFQMMELVRGQCLNKLYQEKKLDREAVSFQLGNMLARMHNIKLEGFGFFNTDILRDQDRIAGLDDSNEAYFYKRLDSHFACLRDTRFLTSEQLKEIENLFKKHSYLLELKKGSVVHKDIAFWNMIGTSNNINAIIDWDDVIIGDPADDLSVVRCFYNGDITGPLYRGYEQITPMTDEFKAKISLYLVRNMVWKAVIRTFMKYFDASDDHFIINSDNRKSLKQFTYDRLFTGIEELKRL